MNERQETIVRDALWHMREANPMTAEKLDIVIAKIATAFAEPELLRHAVGDYLAAVDAETNGGRTSARRQFTLKRLRDACEVVAGNSGGNQ